MTVSQRVQVERFGAFKRALKERGLKSTSQRDDIARVLFASEDHLSVEDLYNQAKKVNPRVGYATVYRTVRLLRDSGLAAERHFDDREARFENAAEKRHHDHLICERCGRIVEFADPEIEKLQQLIARRLDFVISRHKMELYGVCGDCRTGSHARRSERRDARTY